MRGSGKRRRINKREKHLGAAEMTSPAFLTYLLEAPQTSSLASSGQVMAPIDAAANSRHPESRHCSGPNCKYLSEENDPMRYAVPTILAVIVLLIVSCGILSAGAELKSGPQPGESIPAPFHYLNVNGSHAGNPH